MWQIVAICWTEYKLPYQAKWKKKKKNPREQVLAIRDKEKDVADKPSIKFAIPVQAYVVPVPFPRRLRK